MKDDAQTLDDELKSKSLKLMSEQFIDRLSEKYQVSGLESGSEPGLYIWIIKVIGFDCFQLLEAGLHFMWVRAGKNSTVQDRN